ncbi:MAG: thioredoxin [Clostridia bacterium]|nr:thioredoxin [Clostridia bacterium]
MIKELKAEEFEAELKNNDTVLFDFYGVWCMPCKMLAGVLEKADKTLEGKLTIAKIDVDTSTELVKKVGVLTTPTLIVYKNGEEVERAVGFRQEKQILDMVTKYLN